MSAFSLLISIPSIGRGFSLCGAVTGFSLARGRRALPESTVRNLDRRSAGIGVPVRRRSNGDALARYYVNRKTQLYEKTALHVDGSRRLRGVRSEGAARFFDFRYRPGSRLRRRRRARRDVLHALADSGEARILATVSSNRLETTRALIDVINTYFGREEIPLGAPKGEAVSQDTWHKGLRWTSELPARFPHRTGSASQAEDAVAVYRRALAGEPDTSVVVVTSDSSPICATCCFRGPIRSASSRAASWWNGR